MAGKAVAERVAPAVPALAPTPATTITAEDIAVPRLYVANYMSEAFKRKRVDFGDVYLAQGADDTDPQVLWSLDSNEPGVLVHVLHLRKARSWDGGVKGGPLDTWSFEDPAAPQEAWTTYTYTLCLPEVDAEMPARMLLTKSGKPVAQKINTVLARNAAQGPSFINAFRLTSAKRQKDQNEWAIFQAQSTQADPDHVRQAGELFTLLAPGFEQQGSRQSTTTGDEPEI
ncbi:MAG: hypothetical protein ACXVHB_05790 [Solirubrobacteraceae bacterium]